MRTETVTEFHGENFDGLESYCISIAFFRPTLSRSGAPSSDVLVNGIPIEAGATFRIGQNVGDIDVSRYDIVFLPIAGPPTSENEIYVIRILQKDQKDGEL